MKPLSDISEQKTEWVYLDTCTFNRPFDSQEKIDVRFESEAKIYIQEKIKKGKLRLVWSYILEYENSRNPFPMRKMAVFQWKRIASRHILENRNILENAGKFEQMGLKAKDALHVSCAMEAHAGFFVTTDKQILRKLKDFDSISVVSPLDFLLALEDKNDC